MSTQLVNINSDLNYGSVIIPISSEDSLSNPFKPTFAKKIIKKIKDNPTNAKLATTLALISGIDLAGSYMNPLVGFNQFGINPYGSKGLGFLAHSIENNLLIEISNGAIENLNSKQMSFLLGSKMALAILCDLIASKTLGLNSYTSLTSSAHLIFKTLASRLYDEKTFQIVSLYQGNQKNQPLSHLKKRYLANGLLVFGLDCAGAIIDRNLDSSTALSQTITTLNSEAAGLFSSNLYSQMYSRDHKGYLVLPMRLASITLAQIASHFIFPNNDNGNIFGNSLALGSSFGVILLVRILLDRLYKKTTSLDDHQDKKEDSSLLKRLSLNWGLLGVLTGICAVTNRFLSGTQGAIFVNSTYSVANLLLTRTLFDNVKSNLGKMGVTVGQLFLSYVIEQLANYFIPSTQVSSGFTPYIGNITFSSIGKVAAFSAAILSNWIWGKYLGKAPQTQIA